MEHQTQNWVKVADRWLNIRSQMLTRETGDLNSNGINEDAALSEILEGVESMFRAG